jgi:hypothetical protein
MHLALEAGAAAVMGAQQQQQQAAGRRRHQQQQRQVATVAMVVWCRRRERWAVMCLRLRLVLQKLQALRLQVRYDAI